MDMEITAFRSLRNRRLTNYQLRLVARNGKIRYDEGTNQSRLRRPPGPRSAEKEFRS